MSTFSGRGWSTTISPANGTPTGNATVNHPDPVSGVVTGVVIGTDADGDSLTYSGSTITTKGTVEVSADGLITYSPNAMARLLALNPLVPKFFSGMTRIAGDTEGFIQRSTGSRLDREGARCYATLLGNSRHARGALAMMANWDLDTLDRALPGIANPVLLIHARGDDAIPLSGVQDAARKLPDATLEVLDGLGHLAHEEQPERVAQLIRAFLEGRAI